MSRRPSHEPKAVNQAGHAVVRVGDGRGFVVEGPREIDRVVITAAHCLPALPPAHGASYVSERTFHSLLGGLCGEASTRVGCEVLFADPVCDLAVLGRPDDPADADAYDPFIGSCSALRIAKPPRALKQAWLFSLGSDWYSVKAESPRCTNWIFMTSARIEGGMSGSPIVLANGRAVGVVALGGDDFTWNPQIVANLPPRLLLPR